MRETLKIHVDWSLYDAVIVNGQRIDAPEPRKAREYFIWAKPEGQFLQISCSPVGTKCPSGDEVILVREVLPE